MPTPKKQNDNVHAEHRSRMRERFEKYGGDNFKDHELLECFLFPAIPRRNTNVIAHELLNRFGSLSGVLEAPYEDLVQVPGVGENTASFLKITREIVFRISLQEATADRFDTDEAISQYLIRYFSRADREQAALLHFDPQMRLKQTFMLGKGSLNALILDLPEFMRKALVPGVAYIAIAHNHPSGKAEPSSEDVDTTLRLDALCRDLGVNLLDHYIVTGDKCVGIKAFLACKA